MATPEQLAQIREELRTQMVEAHEAELAALRDQKVEARHAADQARLQAEQVRQLLQADTVEARLARLELNQSALGGSGEADEEAQVSCPTSSGATTTNDVQRGRISERGPGDIARI